MKKSAIISTGMFLAALAFAEPVNTVVFSYRDFGPPSLAWETIGHDWWQWHNHGDSRPREYDIKVVVFKSITLPEAQQLYPVVPEKNRDYRYLEYSDALRYLDNSIAEVGQSIPELTARLKQTRQLILDAFGK